MSAPATDQRSRFAGLLVVGILLLHAAVAIWAAAKESVTADEVLYVTGGYYIDRYGDYRIQPENGVLPQRLHGLAALWTNAPTPPLAGNEYWRSSSNLVNSYQFFYETGHDHFPMLMLARALNTLFSIGTGWLVFLWARHLAGARAGVIAAALYAADPTFLAHAALATSDAAAVFLLLASASAFWWTLAAPSPRRIFASAVTFGLACVAKYSAVLLLPVFIGLLAWHFARPRPAAAPRAGRLVPLLVAAHFAGAVVIIWAFHGFRYSGFSPALPPADHYAAPWNEVVPYIGWQGRVVEFCRDWKLLPEAFLYGYAWVLQSAVARASFLAGDYGIYGWTSFFPLAFAWKTTLALLAGLAAALVAVARRWVARRDLIARDLTLVVPLLLFFVIYWAFSLTSHLNIGHRHLLPVYPALFVGVGVWVASLAVPRWRTGACVVLLGAQLVAAGSVAPHFLAFFNRAAGGPANGYRLLVDSSLDWGQDLPGLRDWLRTENATRGNPPVYLSYFGSGEPGYYGLKAIRLPFVNGFKFARTWYELRPGVYCISATMLQQVYSGFGGNWNAALEQEYRRLRQLEPAFRDFLTKPDARPALLAQQSEKQWQAAWTRYDNLRFARLCTELRTREPDAMVGYSILIYQVDEAQLAAGLGVPASGR